MPFGPTQGITSSTLSRSWWKRDDAVSPVIGMILVLAISVVGIGAILVWGLPTIDAMKERVEYKSVQNQFHELDSSVRELVAGTAGKTAKRWQPTMSRGAINVEANSERWLVTIDKGTSYDFTYLDFEDNDNSLTIANHDAAAKSVIVRAGTIDGSAELAVNASAVSGTPAQMTTAVSIPAGGSKAFYFYKTNGQPRTLSGTSFHFEILIGTTVVSEAWLTDVGTIHYSLDSARDDMHVYSSNGAIIMGQGTGIYVENQPPIPPPRTSAGSHRFFMRMVQFNGTGSFSGEGRFDVLLSLYATATLADESGVTSAKVYVTGNLTNAWHTFFLDTTRGYSFTKVTESLGSEVYLKYDYPTGMAFTLVNSVITANG